MRWLAVAALALALAPFGLAQRSTFAISPDSSEVRMRLNTTHEVVNGTFRIASGTVSFDPTDPHLSGLIVVKADSGETGNNSRDKKMKRDILKVDEFTTVLFAPKSYTGAIASPGDSNLQVSGVFTLLGKAHDVTVPMKLHIEGSSMTAKGSLVVPYVDWGLKDPSFFLWKADHTVTIELNLVGQVSR
jgi:polyisoprenoid-binding protein YceI